MDEIDALVAELPDEIVDYIGELQDSNETLQKSLTEAQAQMSDTEDDEPVDDRDPIEKAFDSLDDEAASIFKEKLDRLDILEEKVTSAEIAAADNVFIAKARAYDGLGDPNELGPALRRLAETDPEDAALIEKAFAAAAEQAATSDLYEELGHEIHKSTDVDAQVEVIAKSYQTTDPSMSIEEARSKAWENNPELYEEHSRDQQAKQRL